MDLSPLTRAFHCTQCGGELRPDEGQIFLTCPYCGSTVYLDKAQVVFHWHIVPTLNEAEARAALASWMAGNQTVKDLDRKAHVERGSFAYFPLWYFKRRQAGGQETVLLEPAAATSVSELRHLRLPAGDLRRYEAALDDQAQAPSVPLETALGWLAEQGVPPEQVGEKALVHVPLYTFKYDYNGRAYTALVEGSTGEVFANLYPAKAEAPYLLAGGLTALVFLCLALLPLAGVLLDGEAGLGVGLAACTALGLLAAPGLFLLAAWVAAKV